jgi:hypothetical protein
MNLRVTEYKTVVGKKGYIFKPDMVHYKTDLFSMYFSDLLTKETDEIKIILEKARNMNSFINYDKEIINLFWETFWYGTNEELDKMTKMVYNSINEPT